MGMHHLERIADVEHGVEQMVALDAGQAIDRRDAMTEDRSDDGIASAHQRHRVLRLHAVTWPPAGIAAALSTSPTPHPTCGQRQRHLHKPAPRTGGGPWPEPPAPPGSIRLPATIV